MKTVNFDISLAKAILSGARNGVIKTRGGNTVKLLYIESNYITKDKFNILGEVTYDDGKISLELYQNDGSYYAGEEDDYEQDLIIQLFEECEVPLEYISTVQDYSGFIWRTLVKLFPLGVDCFIKDEDGNLSSKPKRLSGIYKIGKDCMCLFDNSINDMVEIKDVRPILYRPIYTLAEPHLIDQYHLIDLGLAIDGQTLKDYVFNI